MTLPRGLVLSGVVSPAQITADQDDYAPAGFAAASVMQINTDTPRSMSGLAGGTEGRCVTVINVGSQPITLLNESASSSATNRFSLGNGLTISAKQATILRYDGTAARWQAIAGGASGGGTVLPPQGRLTLANGAPVMVTSQSAKTTVYYTPYLGNMIPIYDGTRMVPTAFSELSATTTDTTNQPIAIGANEVNDWYVWNDNGTLRLVHDIYWSTETTRRSGYEHTIIDGIPVNTVAITNGPSAFRGTYIGTTCSDASSKFNFVFGSSGSGGAAARLMVWNAYNRVNAATTIVDTASYTDSSNTIKQFHSGGTGMQVQFVLGAQTDTIGWGISAELALIGIIGTFAIIGVGLDTLTAFSAQRARLSNPTTTSYAGTLSQSGVWTPSIGTHTIAMLQQSDGSNANQFNNAGSAFLNASLWM